MLKTSSRMFVKNSENDFASLDSSKVSTQKANLVSINKNAPSFNINASRFAPKMSISTDEKLVTMKSTYQKLTSSSNITGKQTFQSDRSDSEMGLTRDNSTEAATPSSKTSKYTKETSVRLNFNSKTFKTCAGLSHEQSSMSPQFNHQNFPTNQAYAGLSSQFASGNSCDSEQDFNDEETSNKKKTRRGGRKARLRREREKERTVPTSAVTATESTDKQQVDKTKVKYKTELCKNWIETGRCNYSVRCMFAHGHHELSSATKTEEVKYSYKQSLCERYHNSSECNYGTRCVYIHDERSAEELPSSFFGKNICLLEEKTFFYCSSKRLRVFQQLTSTKNTEEQAQDFYFENINLPSVSESLKAPKEDCLSCGSEPTDTSDCGQEEINSLLEPLF